MCGRYYIDEELASKLEKTVKAADQKLKRMNLKGDIKPSMSAPVIWKNDGHKSINISRWGFARYNGSGQVIHARVESAAEKAMFCHALARQSCIILDMSRKKAGL